MTAIRWDRSALLHGVRLDQQNKAALIRQLTIGPIGYALEGADGRMRATIRATDGDSAWHPAVLVLPHGGDVDLDLYNDDSETHSALLPSNGANRWIWLPVRSHGQVTLNLDGPGYYWYTSNLGKDDGRGLFGAIIVR